VLRLSNGRGTVPVLIDWPSGQEPKRVEIGWDGNRYELRCQYKVEETDEPKGTKTAGIDIGEIHLAAVHTGEESWTVNGRALRSLRRQQNRSRARLDSKIDRKEYGSRRSSADHAGGRPVAPRGQPASDVVRERIQSSTTISS
jgi:putative transposase